MLTIFAPCCNAPTALDCCAMIEVQGLTKLYGTLEAVRDLSFSVAPGEVLGLVGPNGAGKTTTLRSIVGIVRPTEGTIRVGGHDVERDPVAAKRLLAFMPDEPHLFDYLTVEEHLRFTARLYQVADVDQRIPALLQELELSEKATVLPGELSRGMKQKLVIACGLLHDPQALLFDEPLTGLGPAGSGNRVELTPAPSGGGGLHARADHATGTEGGPRHARGDPDRATGPARAEPRGDFPHAHRDMIGAALYLIRRSLVNATRRRVARLRQ